LRVDSVQTELERALDRAIDRIRAAAFRDT
jgi:hypothetical protein